MSSTTCRRGACARGEALQLSNGEPAQLDGERQAEDVRFGVSLSGERCPAWSWTDVACGISGSIGVWFTGAFWRVYSLFTRACFILF